MALIHIAGKSYELIFENRNGWNVEAFRTRYSEVLERYDYIVGDWGYNQLRLKGFFRDGHQKANKDSTFSYAADYINEYCNFGCAYFILEKKQDASIESSEDDIYIDELEFVPVITSTNKEEKPAADAANGTDGKQSSEPRKKQHNNNHNHHKKDVDGSDKHVEKVSDKPKKHHRQSSKVQAEDNQSNKQDGKKEGKQENKPKRKDHYYRKGNRSQDKRAKANKSQAEQFSTANE